MTWEELIAKAEEYARAAGVPSELLQRPKVRETAVVSFASSNAVIRSTLHLDAATGDLISADVCVPQASLKAPGKPFSTRAQAVLARANRESKRVGSDHVGGEHLLSALLAHGQGPGAKTLLGAGLTAEAVRERVRAIGSASEAALESYGPSMHNVLRIACVYADAFRAPEIEPEHFVLGLLDKADGPAMNLFRHFHVNVERAKISVLQALRHEVAP